MKILHTSDWHLGARIGRVDRTDDAFACIDQLTQVLDQEQVDLLLVAGDIFDETRTAQLGGLVRRLAERLAPRLADGLHTVFIAGNHDRDMSVFPLLQATSRLFGAAAAERVSFVQRPAVLEIPSRDAGQAVAVACVPYPTHFRYDLEATGWPSRDVRNRELADAEAPRSPLPFGGRRRRSAVAWMSGGGGCASTPARWDETPHRPAAARRRLSRQCCGATH